jgi:hypothetical protein
VRGVDLMYLDSCMHSAIHTLAPSAPSAASRDQSHKVASAETHAPKHISFLLIVIFDTFFKIKKLKIALSKLELQY